MPSVFNVYCDESCHLEHDGIPTMVIGAAWCPQGGIRNGPLRKLLLAGIRGRAGERVVRRAG